MKIVRVIARLNVGGPARQVVWLASALQDNGYNCVLVSGTVPEGEEDMSYFAAQNDIVPLIIPEMSRELSPKDVISLWKMYKVFRREKPDLIHTHTAKAGTIGRVAGFLYKWVTPSALIGRPRKIHLIHTYHGHVFHSYYGKAKTSLFLFIEKTLARLATDKIITISNQQFDEIHNKFHVGKKNQFAVIPLGIDFSTFRTSTEKRQSFRNEFNIKDDEFLIGHVGRLTEIKNHELFIKSVVLCKNNPEFSKLKIKFIIIGDGNTRKKLEKFAAELKLNDILIFAGNRNDVDVFYSGLDAVALTSLNEGTPLSLIEGMACRVPCISTSVGGVVDLFGNIIEKKAHFEICERGISVDTNDSKAFAEGLIYLAKDKKLRLELISAGADFVESNYSKERLISDIKLLYGDLISNSR